MSGEELELVTEFQSLRAGDLVVYVRCGVRGCGRDHRGILTTRGDEGFTEGFGTVPCWRIQPDPHRRPPAPPSVIIEAAVRADHVYRVVIPPATESRETARPRQLERVK